MSGFGALPPSKYYQLKIQLRGIDSPVWRTIVIYGNGSLKNLHRSIQAVMPWKNLHQRAFSNMTGGELDEKTRISAAMPNLGSQILYSYDYLRFNWEHVVTVQDILDENSNANNAYCRLIDGERACPPESLAMAPTYDALLEALSDEDHEMHQEYRANLTAAGYVNFDPNEFDFNGANQRLADIYG